MYAEFRARYTFDQNISEHIFQKLFGMIAARRLSDNLYLYRKNALKVNANILEAKNKVPAGMSGEVWASLCDYWDNESFKKRSAAGKDNRALLPESAKHTGGSVAFTEHKRRLELKNKGPVSYKDLFTETHKSKKTNEFINPESEQVLEQYNELASQKYGDDSEERFDQELWKEVAGVSKGKNTLRGICYPAISSGASATGATQFPTQHNISHTQQEVNMTFTQEQREDLRSLVRDELGEQQNNIKSFVKDEMSSLFRTYFGSPRTPSSRHPPQSTDED